MKVAFPCVAILMLGACASHPPQSPVAPDPPHCLRETGTRIEPAKGECIAAPGRSYSQEDLRRTGMATTAEAIERKLP